MAKSVERLTLDFLSGHDPRIVGLSPTLGSTLGMQPALDSLSPFFCPFPLHASLSLQTNKQTTTTKQKETVQRYILSILEKTSGLLLKRSEVHGNRDPPLNFESYLLYFFICMGLGKLLISLIWFIQLH